MDKKMIPGTILYQSGDIQRDTLQIFSQMTAVTGFTLSQIREITGLSTATIQNWVKRGWVASPKGKKYDDISLARILIINLLRDSFKLEQIVNLLQFINGDVEDRGDDIIFETELYPLICAIINYIEGDWDFSENHIKKVIGKTIALYEIRIPNFKDKLTDALFVITYGYISSKFKKMAEDEYIRLLGQF